MLTKKLQRFFWIYLTKNFVIVGMDDFQVREAARKCAFVRITTNNYFRVAEFRDKNRGSEYRDKLAREEIGFFAELGDTMVGSIWATMNRSQSPAIARGYMRLMPNEALIHDIVTGEKSRGLGVGPFMVGRMASILLKEFGVSRIIIDVNIKNNSSLRMMAKAGLRVREQVLAISAFGKLAFEMVLRRYV
ncbi:MAG TPA: GNAT family N-acetyltransferase [Nitrososphaera sp.]|nr:GNAT family N-acetyltransferase [Nitrososphaera sp.]